MRPTVFTKNMVPSLIHTIYMYIWLKQKALDVAVFKIFEILHSILSTVVSSILND